MEDEIPDYTVGLSPGARKHQNIPLMCRLVERAIKGDPGDSDDPEELMEVVSAMMDERPSTHVFNAENPGDPGFVVMVQPKHLKLLIVSMEELNDPEVQSSIKQFGFVVEDDGKP
jgi:hypothetical protein